MRCPTDPRGKIKSLQWLKERRWTFTHKVIATNGCFDLVHGGHLAYLLEAAKLGSIFIIGVNSDRAVSQLKGPTRPLQPEHDRALLIACFEFVDYVVIFDDVHATDFITAASPNVYVKGGDYTLETLDPADLKALKNLGADIQFIPLVTGRSTTQLVNKIYTNAAVNAAAARNLRE